MGQRSGGIIPAKQREKDAEAFDFQLPLPFHTRSAPQGLLLKLPGASSWLHSGMHFCFPLSSPLSLTLPAFLSLVPQDSSSGASPALGSPPQARPGRNRRPRRRRCRRTDSTSGPRAPGLLTPGIRKQTGILASLSLKLGT